VGLYGRDAKAKTRELGTVLCTICFRSGRKKRVESIGIFFTALSLISKEQKHKYLKYITQYIYSLKPQLLLITRNNAEKFFF